ncbi:MAG: N-methyl-L-tryptophan oxidase [Candidatus Elarobacter sp.]
MIYDLVVLGLGGMGSSVAAHAARRGKRVLGFERFARGHALGASSGRSRVIRKAYYEHPAYVPLLVRAYELWRELEAASAARILDLVGLLTVGAPDSEMILGAARSAREFDLPLERLDSEEIRRRFGGTAPLPDEVGLLERDAGIVFPEAAVAAHLALAEAAAAELRFETAVAQYESDDDAVRVVLADGSVVKTARLALCAGPWLGAIVSGLALDVRVQRNVQVWFKPTTRAFSADRFPAFFIDRPGWPAAMYGFPDYGFGVKAALHGCGEDTSADRLDREVHATDIASVRNLLDAWMPGAAGDFLEGKACMYALTPDAHFIIDRDPRDSRIVIAGGFSGHGFKFASVVGEIVADLAFEGGTRHPIGFLALDRFDQASP